MNMLYHRIFAFIALVVACVTAAETVIAADETLLTAEKHVVSFNNKSVASSTSLRATAKPQVAVREGADTVPLPWWLRTEGSFPLEDHTPQTAHSSEPLRKSIPQSTAPVFR